MSLFDVERDSPLLGSDIDDMIVKTYPTPIAASWRNVAERPPGDARFQSAIVCAEVTFRLLTALLLADADRDLSQPSLYPEEPKWSPSLGSCITRIEQAIQRTIERKAPAPFFQEAHKWLPQLDAAREWPQFRNVAVHGSVEHSDRLQETLRELLHSLRWLTRYELVTVQQNTDDGRTKRGFAQRHVGTYAPMKPAGWDAVLDRHVVYALNPRDKSFLDLSPLLWPTPSGSGTCAVFQKVDEKGRVYAPQSEYSQGPLNYTERLAALRSSDGLGRWRENRVLEGELARGRVPEQLAPRFSSLETIYDGPDSRVLVAEDHDERKPGGHPEKCALKVFAARTSEMARHELRFACAYSHAMKLGWEPYTLQSGSPALRMNLVEGRQLSAHLATTQGADEILHVAMPLLHALSGLHDAGIAHGHLVGENLLYENGRVHVIDFGASAALDDTSARADVASVGELLYQALRRVIRGKPDGVVDHFRQLLLTMKSGTQPLSAPEARDRLIAILEGDLPPTEPHASADGISPALANSAAVEGSVQAPEVGFCSTEDDARELALKLRAALNGHASPKQLLIGKEDSCNLAAIREAWARLHHRHLRASWPHFWRGLTAGDLINSGVPVSINRMNARLREYTPSLGLERTPLFALTLPELVDTIGRARPRAFDEDASRRQFAEIFDVQAESWSELLSAAPTRRYQSFLLRADQGKARRIFMPVREVKLVQRLIAAHVWRCLPSNHASFGFVPGRPTALHALTHAGARTAVVMDIKDFFGSVCPENVTYSLDNLSSKTNRWAAPFEGWSDEGRTAALDLCFVQHPSGRAYLPQGAPSSPAMANLAAQRVDYLVYRQANLELKGTEWRYSRYADDLVLSTTEEHPEFEPLAHQILSYAVKSMGWRVASQKTRTWREGGTPLIVTGLVVPGTKAAAVALPRDVQRRVRSALHHVHGGKANEGDIGLLAYAYGATGNHAYAAAAGRRIRSYVELLASGVAGPFSAAFINAWLDPRAE